MPDEKENLFATDSTSVIIPSPSLSGADGTDATPNGVDLKSQDIKEAIGGEYVKSIIIPEDLDIIVPNYVIDFTSLKSLRVHQVKALDTLINPDGDVAIYLNLPKGLVKLGMGLGYKLDRILPIGIQSIFEKQCKLYKDVQRGKPLQAISRQNLSERRLNI